MPDGEGWLFRPALKGLCKYESIIDGTLTLEDIAVMNDLIDVDNENLRRYHEANK